MKAKMGPVDETICWRSKATRSVAQEMQRQRHPSDPGKLLVQLRVLDGGTLLWLPEGDLHRLWERMSSAASLQAVRAACGDSGPAHRSPVSAARPANDAKAGDETGELAALARQNPAMLRKILKEAEDEAERNAAAMAAEVEKACHEWFARNVARRAREAGYTSSGLGRRTGKHVATYAKMLRGERVGASLATAVLLARALGCTVEELIEEPGDGPEPAVRRRRKKEAD